MENPARSFPDTLFVTRKWGPAIGGMETWSERLSEELARLGPIEVVALPGKADGLPPSPASLLAFPFTVARRLLTRRTAPRILHLGDMALWPLALLAWLRPGKTRILLTSHGTDVCYPRRGTLRAVLYGGYLRLGSLLLGRQAVLTNSRATAAETRLRGWHDITPVPLATDLAAPPVDGDHDGSILFVGRLVERKGCAWFIREVLPRLASGTRLKVIGKIWDKAEAAALDAAGVTYLGAVSQSELIAQMRQSLCVVLPNVIPENGDFEGFGIVAADAAAVGGVVLAADCGGLSDAVKPGVSGLLLPPGEAEAWAEAIAGIAAWDRDRRRGFIDRAQQHVGAELRWGRVARDVAALYRRIAA